MKKSVLVLLVVLISFGTLFAAGKAEVAADTWPKEAVTVICPWAVGGVADIVNRKTATYGVEVLGKPVLATNELGAGGNVALTNYLKNGPNSYNLIFGGEGAFSIAPNVDGSDAIQFKYEDYVPIINLYSSIFVLTSDAKLNIKDLDGLKAYAQGKKLKVAVNGVAGSEAFLAKALAKDLGINLELVSYNGANLALDAASKGETSFAISHQSQARGSVEAGILNPVVVFDEKGVNNEVFRNVKGVGEYGSDAFFRNRCFILARKGTDQQIIDKVRNAYLTILQKPEIVEFYKSMMIEIDPMDSASINKHISTVASIVTSNI
ncbi:tripartite tricarboxylate transporter substrate-binding protein [Sphaerochaeta sp. PS]|uniref:tripartite tricarboxylate transporter substrate-binding protein n=1 Tax=Sphaerochaeta sp. PS TaxID=3076336 RepID=UPI0028A4B112|nr:tripartite tricarboxylate transporter substrate-binding protein [Sphaerochaeta sp. PS]MDT4762193.1 tripartite tricarboxylate transporter substrate-binding protein [Sphaerochaeta sp. PS]